MREKKVCAYCGEHFLGSKKSKYCSNAHKARAYEKRKGISKPDFIPKITNHVRKTKVNPKISAIGHVVDVQDIELQKLKAERNSLLSQYQRLLNNKPEYKGKVIGLGVGVALTQNKPFLEQLIVSGGLTMLGHMHDVESTKQNELNREKTMSFIQYRIREFNDAITSIEIAKKQNVCVMEQEPKTIPIEIEEEENLKIELPELITVTPNVSNKTIGLAELKTLKFETLKLSDEYFSLIGEPESNFYAVVYGDAGNGKSTWTIKFAEYLSNNFGKVLYNSSEEGISKSLQNKANLVSSDYLHFGNCKDYKSLRSEMKSGHYRFIVLDSINDMKLIPEDLKELRKEFYKCGFIGILQSTKDGKFKGSNEFAHDADIKIRLENYIPNVEKTRFK